MNMRAWLVWGAMIAVSAPRPATAQALQGGGESAPGGAPAGSGEEQEEPPGLPWQLSKAFPIDETNIEGMVPDKKTRNRNPMEFGYFVQDLLEGAELARKNGEYFLVVAYYRALAKAVPERAKSWSKLCEAYAVVNDHERASKMCATALSLPGVELQDYTRFVRETLLLPGKPSPQLASQLKDVLDHLDKQPNIEAVTSHLRCEVGVTLSDAGMLDKCTAALARLEPNNPKTVVYEWMLAMLRGQTDSAARLLKRAKSMNLPSENIERMQALTGAGSSRRYIWTGLGAALFVLAAAGALMVARRRRAAGALAPAAR